MPLQEGISTAVTAGFFKRCFKKWLFKKLPYIPREKQNAGDEAEYRDVYSATALNQMEERRGGTIRNGISDSVIVPCRMQNPVPAGREYGRDAHETLVLQICSR